MGVLLPLPRSHQVVHPPLGVGVANRPPNAIGSWIGLNWVKLGSFSFFEKGENGEFTNVHRWIYIFRIGFV
jgi:hypothetical protein